ncbi:hypothetical protein JHJ32_10390 [Parapedobacter sp. ISTM3]|uniref:Uncharacterized protein n=1 Tax=Parapedobacter luteus TaxID=623280 RepID=A0A1T5AZI1_9SPHI|nr:MULTISPECIES: hypothetical protein [Parapedobacter]MBK1440394.1 hypothetical protein [Parapedobacter sp. ISTM3]SKB40392.1 hypothetical protein SAMN05660226_01210 [Parapedobacter luteus]
MEDANSRKKSKLTLISVKLAKEMVDAYDVQRRQPAAKERSKILGRKVDEPRCVWVSKEAILELLEINNADGIRFYYAVADDYPDSKLKNQEYKLAQTLVMVATKSKDPKDPTMENSVDCLNIPKEDETAVKSDEKAGPIVMPLSSTNAGLPADDLNMCPPPPSEGMLL